MPFTFVETTTTNISIYLVPRNESVKILGVYLVICDNDNHVVDAALKTKANKTPVRELMGVEIEGVYCFRSIGVCKTSAQVYDSNISGLVNHRGGLLHPVLLIETNMGRLEAHMSEFWAVSNCPHRPREANLFRRFMRALTMCDPSVPSVCDAIPIAGRERRTRGGIVFRRGKYIMQMTDYLDARSLLVAPQDIQGHIAPLGVELRTQNQQQFLLAFEEASVIPLPQGPEVPQTTTPDDNIFNLDQDPLPALEEVLLGQMPIMGDDVAGFPFRNQPAEDQFLLQEELDLHFL
eukprot:TRINITY_DN5393_c0_g4_i1.p1 TRINITY_DN5393_c0_g4~~TRINITY_DN5393_c0_g4_i1.p1  ORF type:complete len:292 (-),score=60.00 TRINITY_DN5393_c0_g4_i1:245-1120(-)